MGAIIGGAAGSVFAVLLFAVCLAKAAKTTRMTKSLATSQIEVATHRSPT
jgi:hypothetical protein